MVVFFILYVLVALLCLLLAFYKADKTERGAFGSGVLFTYCVFAAIIVGAALWGEESIKPIDVYRGKTTLEITYKDSVAIDSVVVWK